MNYQFIGWILFHLVIVPTAIIYISIRVLPEDFKGMGIILAMAWAFGSISSINVGHPREGVKNE